MIREQQLLMENRHTLLTAMCTCRTIVLSASQYFNNLFPSQSSSACSTRASNTGNLPHTAMTAERCEVFTAMTMKNLVF